jgi:MFS family permease
MIGIAFGGIVFAPLAHFLIERFGWRNTYVIFGIVIPAVIVPLAVFVIRRSPDEMGLRPDGDPAQSVESDGATADSGAGGLTVREAARTASFWYLFFVQLFMTMGFSIITAHIVGVVTASSFGNAVGEETARMVGARTTSYFLAVSIVGRFMGGFLAEKFSKRYVMVAEYLLVVIAALVLFKLESIAVLWVFVFLFGMGLGAAVVFPLLTAENFGLLSFSKIIGIMGIPFTIGAAIGQVGAAKIFDMAGSYAGVFILLACAFALCSILVLLAKPPKEMASRSTTAG